jgi:hypothetical protein
MTPDGWLWTVLHSDNTKETSATPVKTLKECADDAAQHGYVAWKAEDERRRDLVLGVSKILAKESSSE